MSRQLFVFLEMYGHSPYLIPCLYQIPPMTFLMRAPLTLMVVIALGKFRPEDTYRWMGQLDGGGGDSLGDLRPDNLLIDGNRNLGITGLGSALSSAVSSPSKTSRSCGC